jgi:hypothetical protein
MTATPAAAAPTCAVPGEAQVGRLAGDPVAGRPVSIGSIAARERTAPQPACEALHALAPAA